MVLCGPPGSGKTTLAVPLARGLGLPLLAKDTVKEALMDSLGAESLERSRELGQATFAVLNALAATLLEVGTGLVLEANFTPLGAADLAALAAKSSAVVIHCWAPAEVLRARYGARAALRHPGHRDSERLDRVEMFLAGPPDLGVPYLRVDTSGPSQLEAVLDWTRAHLASTPR